MFEVPFLAAEAPRMRVVAACVALVALSACNKPRRELLATMKREAILQSPAPGSKSLGTHEQMPHDVFVPGMPGNEGHVEAIWSVPGDAKAVKELYLSRHGARYQLKAYEVTGGVTLQGYGDKGSIVHVHVDSMEKSPYSGREVPKAPGRTAVVVVVRVH